MDDFDLEKYRKASDLVNLIHFGIDSKKITINANGHFASENELDDFHLTAILQKIDAAFLMDNPKLDEIQTVISNGREIDGYVNIVTPKLFDCSECGDNLGIRANGEEIKLFSYDKPSENGELEFKDKYCKYPNGIPAYTMQLECPSGVLVIDDDLREFFNDTPRTREFNVNNNYGIVNTSKYFEKQGMLHGFVGNSCPGIYKKDDLILIGTPGNTEDSVDDEKKLIDEDIDLVCEKVGGIVTDLWWYSIADLDHLSKINKKKLNSIKGGWAANFIPVTPGTYEIRHQYHLLEEDYENPQIYARMHKI